MGPHVNAYTSFDETVYMFQVPTDKPGIVDKGLQALADVGGGLTLDPKEIDKERGVVIEEWRGGLGAAARIRDQQIPVLFYKSKYAERLPIGKPEVLKSFTREQLASFYVRWYRPDRMALVIVGDIDPAQMERQVQTMFGSFKKPATAAPARAYEIPLPPEMLVKTATDPEATQSSISIVRRRTTGKDQRVCRLPPRPDAAAGRADGERALRRVVAKKEAQFLGASADDSTLGPGVSIFTLGATVEEGKLAQALAALQIESNRVAKHGFGAAELDRAKKWMLASYERAYSERDKSESGGFAAEYRRSFSERRTGPRHRIRISPGAVAGAVDCRC